MMEITCKLEWTGRGSRTCAIEHVIGSMRRSQAESRQGAQRTNQRPVTPGPPALIRTEPRCVMTARGAAAGTHPDLLLSVTNTAGSPTQICPGS
ncbi:hypothetical protein SKAU_G00252880 [Synaphobranchus kaupii]|uniref:Uncharacterized protein n=1 Tax=Synaphobranchus kaupii TaxID=118154 RepID=A0A9Q1F368_SYNKA|nr:hypothetical protein SKAU_G00252880 [Synaphobranchus kaupii]